MTKLRFTLLGGGGGNRSQSNYENSKALSKSTKTRSRLIRRHVSPFRRQANDKATTESSHIWRSKAPGRALWFVNTRDVMNATASSNSPPKRSSSVSKHAQDSLELAATTSDDKCTKQLSDNNNRLELNVKQSNTHLPHGPARREYCDPEEILSIQSTPARSDRVNYKTVQYSSSKRPSPLSMETVELVVSSSFRSTMTTPTTSQDVWTPPDPEGLELWTTPTKSTTSPATNQSSDEDDSSSTESQLLLLGGDEDDNEKMLEDNEEGTSGMDYDGNSSGSSKLGETAEMANIGAYAEQTLYEDESGDYHISEEQRGSNAAGEQHVDVMEEEEGVHDDDKDAYILSLAPSEGFGSVSLRDFSADLKTSLASRQGSRSCTREDDKFTGLHNSVVSRVIASPPLEVLTIRGSTLTHNTDPFFSEEYSETKEEIWAAHELAENLSKELEDARGENDRLASRNRRLQTYLTELKKQQDQYLIRRSRLVKACLLISPVFVLCGGLNVFCITIWLVWVLVEIESYIDLGDEKATFSVGLDGSEEIFDNKPMFA